MRLNKLLLINYRNYRYQNVAFHPRLNVFLGDNAQGKTNLLESLYLAARGMPFKNVRDRELIRFGERSGYVRAEMDRGGRKKIVECKLSMVDRKRIRINEVEVENLRELNFQFDVVLFAPEDLRLVQEGPALRREYLDALLRGIDPLYRKEWERYRSVLFQRNQLLKRRPEAWMEEQLQVYDQQLTESAEPIVRKRAAVANEVSKRAQEFHQRLSQGREQLQLSYQTAIEAGSGFSRSMQEQLHRTRARDLEQHHTEIGPHRDDLALAINGLPVRRYASQGQSRTATLALKWAEIGVLESHNGSAPIVLLDDVFSELDHRRAHILLQSIQPYQVMITANDLAGITVGDLPRRVFRVVRGEVFPFEVDGFGEEKGKL